MSLLYITYNVDLKAELLESMWQAVLVGCPEIMPVAILCLMFIAGNVVAHVGLRVNASKSDYPGPTRGTRESAAAALVNSWPTVM